MYYQESECSRCVSCVIGVTCHALPFLKRKSEKSEKVQLGRQDTSHFYHYCDCPLHLSKEEADAMVGG